MFSAEKNNLKPSQNKPKPISVCNPKWFKYMPSTWWICPITSCSKGKHLPVTGHLKISLFSQSTEHHSTAFSSSSKAQSRNLRVLKGIMFKALTYFCKHDIYTWLYSDPGKLNCSTTNTDLLNSGETAEKLSTTLSHTLGSKNFEPLGDT